jgi:hypothetical protein
VDLALSPCGVLLAQKAYYFPGVQSTPLSQKIKKQQLQSELYLAAQKKKLDSMFNINHVLLLCMYKCHHVVIQLLLTFLLLGYGKVHMF